MPPERTQKRIRQACEPCRRKKSKCPGERPVCSSCARLSKECIYANEEAAAADVVSSTAPANPARLEALEAKLEAVLQAVGLQNGSQTPTRTQANPVTRPARVTATTWTSSSRGLPAWETIEESGVMYIQYCDCQPLPLFHSDTFSATLKSRDPEVLFSILALTVRFLDMDRVGAAERSRDYLLEARKLVDRSIFEGSVRLSTLQSLCLISLVDFTDGNTQRASLTTCIAIELAHSAGILSDIQSTSHESPVVREEKHRCAWSIFLCSKLHGSRFNFIDLSVKSELPSWPKSPEQPSSSSVRDKHEAENILMDDSQPARDDGILACIIQLSDVWCKTTQYARRRGKPTLIPPWSSQSDYSIIVSYQMDFETKVPYKHRFKVAEFHNRPSHELELNRSYWGPWLFIQFLYHTNICLLNHPLLLSLRLRSFRNCIPEMFLQQTSDLVSSHSTWVIRFIDMLESKNYKISDPFLGHCAAIVATIHLQYAYTVTDPVKQEEKQAGFTKCLRFISVLGERWPNMARIAEKLQTLERIVSANNEVSSPQMPSRGMLIDLGRFWEILDYCAASAKPRSAQSLIATELHTAVDATSDGVSLTSPLPDTFRLGDYNGQDSSIQTTGQTPAVPVVNSEIEHSNAFAEMAGGGATEWTMDFNAFSDDELGVLADNFFNVGGQNGGRTNDEMWWNFGNL